MGRVNSLRRARYASATGCGSADGTFVAHGPDRNLPELLGWVRDIATQGVLFGGARLWDDVNCRPEPAAAVT